MSDLKSVELSIGDIESVQGLLVRLLNHRLPLPTSYRLSRFQKQLQSVSEDFFKAVSESREKYLKLDETGKPVIEAHADGRQEYVFQNEDVKKDFLAQVDVLKSEKHTFSFIPVPVSHFDITIPENASDEVKAHLENFKYTTFEIGSIDYLFE